MIILDRSGRDLVRRPPALFRPRRGALLALVLAAAIVGGPAPQAPPASTSAQPQPRAAQERVAPLAGAFRRATPI